MTSVLLIDDHAIVREGLKRALSNTGFTITGEAASQAEARAQIAHKNPDVIIVDLNLPDGTGFDVIIWARNISKTIGIVVLTLHEDDAHLLAAMQAGASAYILKSAPITELVAAITHSVAAPLNFVGRGVAQALNRKSDGFGLTARELDVLELLPSGSSNIALSKQLFLSEATIKTHLAAIYRKLSAENRTQAVAIARKAGLVSNL